jgi:SMC interacting uncharacterized protein involved in chromosome segregation
MAEDNWKACGMSRQSEAYENAIEGLSESMREFENEWNKLKVNVELFLENLKSGHGYENSGIAVKLGSSRLSFLCAEILAFRKRLDR